MAGAQLRFLQGPQQVGLGGEGLAYGIAAVAMDDADVRRRERPRAIDDMGQQRFAGDRMQHLGQAGAHALALTGGENDDIEHGFPVHAVRRISAAS